MEAHPLAPLVQRLSTHVALSDADKAAILALPLQTRLVQPNTYLVREGELPATCSILVSGFAFRQKLTGDGERQIVSLHIAGEPLDLQHLYLRHADHNVQALTRAEIANVPRAAFLDLVERRRDVARAVMANDLVEAAIGREWLLNVGRRKARARLAHLLCEFALRMDAQGLSGSKAYQLPMNQEQLGDALGLTSVHVNRTLKVLVKEGLLIRSGRTVEFPDIEELREVGDFNALYLHLDQPPTG